MNPNGRAPARSTAVVVGLTIGALTVVQYAHLTGLDPLAYFYPLPRPVGGLVRGALVAIALLLTFESARRTCRVIGTGAALRWFGSGAGVFLLLLLVGTFHGTRSAQAGDTREALQFFAAPIASVGLLVLLSTQLVVLYRYAWGTPGAESTRAPLLESTLLAATSIAVGLGPFRQPLGEWHYVIALLTGDAACVGFLTASCFRISTRSDRLDRWARPVAALVGLGMGVLAISI